MRSDKKIINDIFWVLMILGLAIVLYQVRYENYEIKISIVSAAIALLALWMNIFPKYIQGSILRAFCSQVVSLGISEDKKKSVISKIILSEVMRDDPRPEVEKIISSNDELRKIVKNRDEKAFEGLNSKIFEGLYIGNYLIEKFLNNIFCIPPFYIPIIIHNSGGKTGHVVSIIMNMKSRNDNRNNSRVWTFHALFEVDPQNILDPKYKDNNLWGGLFTGCFILPGESRRIDLYFSPYYYLNNEKIIDMNLTPGNYEVIFTGFNEENSIVLNFETTFVVTQQMLLGSFHGARNAHTPNLSKNMLDAISKIQIGDITDRII